jgi:DNA-directed RNA polymerase subunit RPC12/RpoP
VINKKLNNFIGVEYRCGFCKKIYIEKFPKPMDIAILHDVICSCGGHLMYRKIIRKNLKRKVSFTG